MLMPLVFKKNEKKWQAFFRRYWPWLTAALIILILLSLLAPYIFRPWTKYPEELRAEMAWRRFVASFSLSCREECLAERQSYADIWRPYFTDNQERASAHYRQIFATDKSEVQAAVIKIMAADWGREALPAVLAEVIADAKATSENKRLIVTAFPKAFADEDWQQNIRIAVIDRQAAEADRIYALRLLAPFPEEENIGLIKNIIINENSPAVIEAALKIATGWPLDTITWSGDELRQQAQVLIKTEDKAGRWRRLWYLSEVGQKQPELLKQLLSEIVNLNQIDAITRGLAAETLRTKFGLNISTPEPTESEWQEYYENI